MKKSKRERLEKAGWRVGGVEELLGLMPEEAAFVEMKLALAESVRRRRQAQHRTQTQLAEPRGVEPVAGCQDRGWRPLGLDRSAREDAAGHGASRSEVARVIRGRSRRAA